MHWTAIRPVEHYRWPSAASTLRSNPSCLIAAFTGWHNRHIVVHTFSLSRRSVSCSPRREVFSSPQPTSPTPTLNIMLALAYCAGLRLGEIVRLNVCDVDLADRTINIRDTKFFKSRRLPLSASVVVALQCYLAARYQAGAPNDPSTGLFWHPETSGRYSYSMAGKLLVDVLCRAGLKPVKGRRGPRVHDLRHAFVVNRMLTWYREGINPQTRLPYLATYLGHKDINSTLVYLTTTQELLQQAGERFRVRGAASLRFRRRQRMKLLSFPHLLHSFFHEWLVQQRNISHHTVLSYRDSWRLFLRFVAARKQTCLNLD